MSDNKVLDEIVNRLLHNNDENVDNTVKEASDEAETNDNESVDLDALATKVAEKLRETSTSDNNDTFSKTAKLVEKLNKEAEDISGSQEMIITNLFNIHCADAEYNSDQIIKMASEENSIIPQLIDSLYKYAATADAVLAEEYGDDYDENDVVEFSSAIINSVDNPFGLEEVQKEAEESAVVDNIVDEILVRLQERLS